MSTSDAASTDVIEALQHGIKCGNDRITGPEALCASVMAIRSRFFPEDGSTDVEMDVCFSKSLLEYSGELPLLATYTNPQRETATQIISDSVFRLSSDPHSTLPLLDTNLYPDLDFSVSPTDACTIAQAHPKDSCSHTFTISFHQIENDLPRIRRNVQHASGGRATLTSALVTHGDARLNLVLQIHPHGQGPPGVGHVYISMPDLLHSAISYGVSDNIPRWTGESNEKQRSVRVYEDKLVTLFRPHPKYPASLPGSTGSHFIVECDVDVGPENGTYGLGGVLDAVSPAIDRYGPHGSGILHFQ